MNDLRNKFIRQSAADLDELVRRIKVQQVQNQPPNLTREISNKLHTVKGTAQTFELPDAARFAHQLENLLDETKTNLPFDGLKPLLVEGISILSKLLSGENVSASDEFTAKIGAFDFVPVTANLMENVLPEAVYAKLSDSEKSAAAKQGNKVSVVEIYFEKAKFAAEFKQFRAGLESAGEIIAVLPNSIAEPDKIGFQVIFAARNAAENIDSPPKQSAHGLDEIFAAIAAHGASVARQLKKDCRFTAAAEPCELSDDALKTIFDALLHLVRNAVDHGIEKEGSVKINAKMSGENLILTVADDGGGLDAEKIKTGAARRNLIVETELLTARQINDLIFAPGFSTAAEVSEFSGRGTGLDAVRTTIENVGGKISVKSESGKGTTFEIVLPVSGSKKPSFAE